MKKYVLAAMSVPFTLAAVRQAAAASDNVAASWFTAVLFIALSIWLFIRATRRPGGMGQGRLTDDPISDNGAGFSHSATKKKADASGNAALVYFTNGGSSYHWYSQCRYIRGKRTKTLRRSQAIAMGLKPCRECYPYDDR